MKPNFKEWGPDTGIGKKKKKKTSNISNEYQKLKTIVVITWPTYNLRALNNQKCAIAWTGSWHSTWLFLVTGVDLCCSSGSPVWSGIYER